MYIICLLCYDYSHVVECFCKNGWRFIISIVPDINTLRQKSFHFPNDIFKSIILNEKVYVSIKISLNLFPMGPINNIPALV